MLNYLGKDPNSKQKRMDYTARQPILLLKLRPNIRHFHPRTLTIWLMAILPCGHRLGGR
ncbi:hypothetical protein KCP71_22920 [Salmonella enterica subsp. enterica]|nr:hypothetical protein KCP71_22920 [Salmonella enterica subsp. enterica]